MIAASWILENKGGKLKILTETNFNLQFYSQVNYYSEKTQDPRKLLKKCPVKGQKEVPR